MALPLSYGERLDNAQPMLSALTRARFVIVPVLTDRTLTERFQRFDRLCRHAAGTRVDAQDIHRVVRDVRRYGEHVRECVSAHLDDKPMPAEPAGMPSLDD